MSVPYKTRTQAVRSAAKARLAELRAERRARLRRAPSPNEGPSGSTSVAPVVAPPDFEVAPGRLSIRPEPQQDGAAALPAAPVPGGAPMAALAGLASEAGDVRPPPAAGAEHDPPEGTTRGLPAASALAERGSDVSAPGPEAMHREGTARDGERGTDLYRLPWIGPGLVWALGQAGIERLEDLAAADPDRLASDLGPLGALLDVGGWVAAARRMRGDD